MIERTSDLIDQQRSLNRSIFLNLLKLQWTSRITHHFNRDETDPSNPMEKFIERDVKIHAQLSEIKTQIKLLEDQKSEIDSTLIHGNTIKLIEKLVNDCNDQLRLLQISRTVLQAIHYYQNE